MRTLSALLLSIVVLLGLGCSSCQHQTNPVDWSAVADGLLDVAEGAGPPTLRIAAAELEVKADAADKPAVCVAAMAGAAELRALASWIEDGPTTIPAKVYEVRRCGFTPVDQIPPGVEVVLAVLPPVVDQVARPMARTCDGQRRGEAITRHVAGFIAGVRPFLLGQAPDLVAPAASWQPCDTDGGQ